MNSISLTQVTAFVVAVSMASFLVSADDVHAHNAEDNKVEHVEHSASPAVAEEVKAVNDKFTFTSLDSDKDGKLSQQEVLAGKNDWLVKSFKQIDNNADELLTEQELVDFVAKNTSKATN